MCSKQDDISLPSTLLRSFVSFWFCKRALFTQTHESPNCIKEAYAYRALYQERQHLYPPHRCDTLPNLPDHLFLVGVVKKASRMCMSWLIHMYAMTHAYVCHDSFICVSWRTHMHLMPHAMYSLTYISKMLQNLILRTGLWGTGFITQHGWVVQFRLSKMVRWKCFLPLRHQEMLKGRPCRYARHISRASP